jgi:hypothetical protein
VIEAVTDETASIVEAVARLKPISDRIADKVFSLGRLAHRVHPQMSMMGETR